MSRSFGGGGVGVAADEGGLRQQRGRLMQLASSGSTKRRAYSAQHAVFKSAPTPRHSGIPGKLLSFEEVVRNDPSYTPNIEHLVFPSRRNSIGTKGPGAAGGGSVGGGGGVGGGKSARARLAEVFALTRSQGSRKAQSHEKSKSRENSITRSSFSQKVGGGGGSERGGGGGDPGVCGGTEETSNRSSGSAAQSTAVSPSRDSVEATQPGSNRGPNVSVLHLRSTSEPWETAPVRSLAGGGSRRQHSQAAPPPKQKSSQEQQQQQTNGSNKVNRELSPVRWCDREVDGVYLGRSGWVQVQQRSLDDNRRVVGKYSNKSEVQNSNLHSRIKMADYHCSKSEPGKLPPPPLLRQEEIMTRPGYLPLPGEPPRRTKEKPSPSSLDLSHEEPITPPPVTPIISPPPAFQDTNKQRFDHPPRTRPPNKAPFLSRSNAVELSPPPSPPRSTFRTPDPKITAALGGPIAARNRWFGPSPVAPQGGHSVTPHQTKSLEESAAASSARRTLFQKYGDSSSSSSSSFGFRSLDNTLAARSLAMPRLTETDSSIGGYEDGYEEDNVITLVSSSPESGERNDRSRQLLRQASRRSPGSSDGSGGNKLGGGGGSHSSSTSSSDDGSRSPFRRPGTAQGGQGGNVHHSQANSHHLHTGGGKQQQQQGSSGSGGGSGGSNSARVRRSRSLQLPERKSPVSPAQQQQQAYYTSKGYPVVVKVGDDQQQQQRIKRHLLQQQRMSEEALKREELLRREAEAVTEFLWSARSREAARALLSQRAGGAAHQQQQQPQPSFNVVFVGGGSGKSQRSSYGQQQQSQRARGLQRGSSTPVSKGSSPVGGFCPNPCNPTTCDFWPHCAHRDGIYTTTKASAATPSVAPQPPTSLRLSQSYPSTATDRSGGGSGLGDKRSRLEPNARHNYQSIRSSPASLERVDHDTAVSPDRHNAANFHTRRGNSLNVSPEWRSALGPQCCQHLHPPRRSHEKPGFKVGLSDTSSSSVDAYQPRDSRSPCDNQSLGDKVSPIEVNSVVVNADDALSPSSSSSSSSEVWLTTSDRTLTKSDRTLTKSDRTLSKSPRRTPQEETVRLPGSELESRPGSAPGGATSQQPYKPYKPSQGSGGGSLEPQHRSLSLPKSFQAKESLSHSGGYVRSATHSPAPTLRPPTPETARTAPATPVREVNGDSGRSRSPGPSADVSGGGGVGGGVGSSLGKGKARFSSTPQLEPPTSSDPTDPRWNNTAREWHDEKSVNDKELLQSQRNIQGSTSESVLQKFRKSFSLRFYRKGIGGSKDGDEDESDLPSHESPAPTPPPALVNKDDTSEKFRFGPLIWRSSKERKKGKKAAREAKCNSGDSGIQIEMVGRTTGDSSESHDTDHLCDDDIDSPPAVRRRSTLGSEGKPSRPTSDVINQILIDKLRADLHAHALTRKGAHRNVRRTHSDLGGQRLFNWEMRNSYRRMFSTPSPIKIRANLSPRKSNSSTQDLNVVRTSKRFGIRPTGMRRCISQPLGINDLSPLMRRKPSGARNQVLSEDERGATSDDEMLSDSESSVASLNERKKSFELAMDEEVVILAEAVWDHVAMETEELAFRAGDVIEVLDTLDRDWWWGARNHQVGWFPSAFVRLRVSQEDTVEDCLAAIASGGSKQLRRRTSISLLSNDQVRSRVVRELINTERDFVKVLRDVAEGYLTECRRRNDMFSDEQIATIFGNLEQLLEFQSDFLEDLERHVDWDTPHKSCLGDTFLRHQAGFRMYSEYCNSHPLAIATLQELYQHNSYSKFFEACRLMRGLIEIPLDGYLLTPVQRICKYPLQLAELLKYTKADHMDHDKIKEALEAMRGVAILINERKRRMESLEKLAAWQQRVEGWEGEDLIETSSQLIFQGEAIRVTTGMWTNNITLFLFDHQLVYCKKDILKRNTYVYKGRIQLDTSEVINLNDGKDPQLNVTVRHAIKVYSCVRDKWLLFCCRTQEEKTRWLEAFGQERRLVKQDLQDGLEFAPAARHLARMAAARCYRMPPSKPRGKSYKRGNSVNAMALGGMRASSNGVNGGGGGGASLGRRVGTWFTFGANKKTRALGRAATLQTVHPS